MSYYIAVIVSESRSSAPAYTPLYEESFVLIAASSLEEAWAKAEARKQDLTYENVYGDTVSWSPRLVGMGEALADVFEDGAEVYARFFRNRAAYDQLEFESFDKTEEQRSPKP